MARCAALLLAAVFTGFSSAPQRPDASQVLADMRQALGGDALKTVEAFSVKGSEDRLLGRSTVHADVEWAGILPDRFIEERRGISSTTITVGFNGDGYIRQFKGLSGGRGGSQSPGGPAPLSEAAARALMILEKRHFSRLAIGMFGVTPLHPLDATYVSRETLDGKPVHLLELRGPDDFVARLCVDVSSHLPRMISWMGRPVLPTLSPFVDAVRDAQEVEHRLYFSDYEKRDGLNWPHRIKEVVGKETVLAIRLGKFKINPRIDPKRFDPAR